MAKVSKSKNVKKKSIKKAPRKARTVLDLPKAIEERLAEGRANVSGAAGGHAEWTAPADRPDPVGVLEKQNATRVAELVPIRHGRMIVSPFTFYRGGAAIMAWDLSAPRRPPCASSAAVTRTCRTSACFAAPDRRMVIRPQRLRRDAPGTVRVGRQAARRELRRGRARQRPPTQGPAGGGARGDAVVPDDDGPAASMRFLERLVRADRRPTPWISSRRSSNKPRR